MRMDARTSAVPRPPMTHRRAFTADRIDSNHVGSCRVAAFGPRGAHAVTIFVPGPAPRRSFSRVSRPVRALLCVTVEAEAMHHTLDAASDANEDAARVHVACN